MRILTTLLPPTSGQLRVGPYDVVRQPGQVCQCLALQMTALDIKSAFLNQPIEVANLRLQFQKAIGLGACLLQLLQHMGYADIMPRSYRRPHDFNTQICEECAEVMVERYARIKNGKTVCIPCAEKVG